jgi:ferredoxin-thioredoxin reductase catalytic subunit
MRNNSDLYWKIPMYRIKVSFGCTVKVIVNFLVSNSEDLGPCSCGCKHIAELRKSLL